MRQRSQRESRQSACSFTAAIMLPSDVTVENRCFRNFDREQSVHCYLEHGRALLNFPQILSSAIIKPENTPQHRMLQNRTVKNFLLQGTSLHIFHLSRNHGFMLFVRRLRTKPLVNYWLSPTHEYHLLRLYEQHVMLVITVAHRCHSRMNCLPPLATCIIFCYYRGWTSGQRLSG